MDHELPQDLYVRIKARAAEGDVLAGKGQYEAAVRVYNEAWKEVPEPKNEWDASTWLLAAIGDACFLGGFFGSGLDAFGYAIHCPGGFGNPFIHLRLGQCHLQKENLEEAAEHLTRAYALEGKAIFAAEDPQYFAFLQTRIAPPAGGEW